MKLIKVEPAEVIVSMEFAELAWLATLPRLIEDFAIPEQDQVKLRMSAAVWQAWATLTGVQDNVEVV